jgi:hypothetical protein
VALVLRGPMDAHERATSVWYRVAGLLRRKELAIDIIEGEIRSAQREVWLEASRLVLTPGERSRSSARCGSGRRGPSNRNKNYKSPTRIRFVFADLCRSPMTARKSGDPKNSFARALLEADGRRGLR